MILRERIGGTMFWKTWFVVVFWVAILSIATASCVKGGVELGRHYGRVNCQRYAQNTQRQVRFVNYTFWSWDCLTPNPSQPGTWIPIGQLRGVK